MIEEKKYKGQTAISYLRASEGKGRGQDDSTDRQGDEAIIYCDKLGLNLDASHSYIDEGVSAFKQVKYHNEKGEVKYRAKNIQEGYLAQFTEEVKNGIIQTPVHLIVEKLDRVYRDKPRTALMHFLILLDSGVTIHTIMDNYIYDPDAENEQEALLISIVRLCASHEYSKTLSERQKLSRKRRINKMENEEVYYSPLGKVSSWIDSILDSTGQKIPHVTQGNKNIISEIFARYTEEGLSSNDIANMFNEKAIKNFSGKGWDRSYIVDILKSRNVMGYITINGDYEKYYKEVVIIPKAQFNEAQTILKKRKGSGKQSSDKHIFTNIIKCGYCLTEKKNGKNKGDLLPSTLIYNPQKRDNQTLALSVKQPVRHYRCKGGATSGKNCTGSRLDYYQFYESFFAFIKELDFSTLIDVDANVDRTIQQRRILEIDAEISECDLNIKKYEKFCAKYLKDENDDMFNQYADKIAEENDTRKSLLTNRDKAKTLIDISQNSKAEVLANEVEIKELLKKAQNDNEWYAYENLRIELEDKWGSKGEYKNYSITKKEISMRKELSDIFDLKIQYKNNQDEVLLDKREKLRQKYFAKEITKDVEAIQLKQRLSGLLSKFIKEIKFYPFGFSLGESTRPFQDRPKGEYSCNEKHQKDLGEWLAHSGLIKDYKQGGIDFQNIDIKKEKWSVKNLMDTFKLSSKSTWYKWVKNGCPDPREKHKGGTDADIKETIKWVKKNTKNQTKNRFTTHDYEYYKRFMGFSVEFTDLCKPDSTKYVVPYWKDNTQGICYEYNSKRMMLVQEFAFGEGTRNNQVHTPDPFFIKANALMDDHVDAGRQIKGYISSIPRKISTLTNYETGILESDNIGIMIPHSWKKLSFKEIIENSKKEELYEWASENKKEFHPIIKSEKQNIINYEPLYFMS